MKTLRFHLKDQMNQIEFQACFGVLWILSLVSFLMNCLEYYESHYTLVRSAADSFMLVSTSSNSITKLFALLFPLICAVLCAGCRKKNESAHSTLFPLLRMNKKQYVLGGASSVFILTVGSFFLALCVNQILCFVAFPMQGFDNRWGTPIYMLASEYDSTALFDFWKIQNPYLYNVLYIFIISMLAGGIALLCYGLSFIKRFQKLQPIQLAVGVFALFMAFTVFGQGFSIPIIDFLSFVETGHVTTIAHYAIFAFVIYIVGIIFIVKGLKDYEYC